MLEGFRDAAQSEYEAGAYFEELIARFFTTEARHTDLRGLLRSLIIESSRRRFAGLT